MRVSDAADLIENDEGGAVFVWGMAASCWDHGDIVARRLAAVQLVVTGAATQVEVGAAFGAGEATVQRWVAAWRRGGADALVPAQKGPRGPSKLTPEVVAGIRALRAEGASMDAIAAATGLSRNSVSRALAPSAPE
ncbi:MAG: helix-turn-helix domain-containing protein, partial [Actinomycetota bacterium]|nr:helix-turn-helix domain-containing protein [Actinomycetota bacterium]